MHAEAAALSPGDRLLELACGYGASLALWQQEFSVTAVSALEYRAHCVAQVVKSNPHHAGRIFQGRFDRPLPVALVSGKFDVVLCVDAAYHADSLQDFIATSRSALDVGGRLVFSTLLKRSDGEQNGLLDRLLRLAAIPSASLTTETAMKTLLAQQGFSQIRIDDLSPFVFGGFYQWVDKRHKALSWREALSPGWLKIRITARLCRWLACKPLLQYALVHACREA